MLMLVPHKRVLADLDGALAWLADQGESDVYAALQKRVQLRRGLLSAFALDGEAYLMGAEAGWDETLALVGEVERSHALAKDVPEAWSMSVQRKLGSSVPPRPVVENSFEDAAATLKQLCKQTKDIERIMEYRGATEVLVGFCHASRFLE